LLQHAGSGDPISGSFGGVRSEGRQFHEGIDIQPLRRDRQGEALDPVYAVLDGVVRHINAVPGKSSYGRYIVLEHPGVSPAIYTLYSHLARIAPGLKVGAATKRGATLGIMGRSASGYAIPKERAHLHFEMGLMITRDFQRWYDSRKFGSRNEHGLYNGMNLMGFDPLDFFRRHRARRVDNFVQYFAQMEPVVKLRIATMRTPDFVQRYPALVTKASPMLAAGWEIWFDWTGLPFRWTPLTAGEVAGLGHNQVRIIEVNQAEERRQRSKTLVVSRKGNWVPGSDLQTVLQQLFDWK
jgi:murein DD-endopeptidase MepM/ murein hydrolase activator NlpD